MQMPWPPPFTVGYSPPFYALHSFFHPFPSMVLWGKNGNPMFQCVWIFLGPRHGLRSYHKKLTRPRKGCLDTLPQGGVGGQEKGREWRGASGCAVSQNGTTHHSVMNIHLSTPFVRTISGYSPPFYALHSFFHPFPSMVLWGKNGNPMFQCVWIFLGPRHGLRSYHKKLTRPRKGCLDTLPPLLEVRYPSCFPPVEWYVTIELGWRWVTLTCQY